MIYVVIGKQDVVCYACADKLFNRLCLFFLIVVLNTNEKRKDAKVDKTKRALIFKNFKGILLLHPLKNRFFSRFMIKKYNKRAASLMCFSSRLLPKLQKKFLKCIQLRISLAILKTFLKTKQNQ